MSTNDSVPTASSQALIQSLVGNIDGIEWRHPAWAILLSFICLFTIGGNVLVVVAVCTKKYLRNPTGYLIISLAIADLIVGMVVMPLNSLFEMTNHKWILGLAMCDIFHSLDILASTSSIWNLCIISLDRYLAGQDPIGYRDKVNKKRMFMCICCVWLVSAGLAFPAIYWWRSSSPHLYEHQDQCLFTDSTMYIVFSALVSFYIPLFLILFAYGKVFLIATRHSAGMRRGMKKVKCKAKRNGLGESESMLSSENEPTLRIHFGRKRSMSQRASRQGKEATRMLLKQVSCKSLHDRGLGEQATFSRMSSSGMLRADSPRVMIRPESPGPLSPRARSATSVSRNSSFRPSFKSVKSPSTMSRDDEPMATPSTPLIAKKKLNVREKSRQMMKYVHEQRAARTLSIVVGAFILCWTPFFVFVPLTALCKNCFVNEDSIFTLFTWAGHLNSMLNPLIYSRFSRDFRRAFKQILTCQRQRKVKTAFKTPLSLVFTQLISVTQMWEQPQNAISIDE